jgi:hypothetical protein
MAEAGSNSEAPQIWRRRKQKINTTPMGWSRRLRGWAKLLTHRIQPGDTLRESPCTGRPVPFDRETKLRFGIISPSITCPSNLPPDFRDTRSSLLPPGATTVAQCLQPDARCRVFEAPGPHNGFAGQQNDGASARRCGGTGEAPSHGCARESEDPERVAGKSGPLRKKREKVGRKRACEPTVFGATRVHPRG